MTSFDSATPQTGFSPMLAIVHGTLALSRTSQAAAAHDAGARVVQALRRTPEISGCGISWYVEEGALVLRGRVRSFYQKQVAQTVAIGLDGFDRVINELEVTNIDD